MRRIVVGLAISTFAVLAFSWAHADDQKIARDITEQLKQEQNTGSLQGFDIDLKVANGNVLLKGRVSSPAQRRLAMEVVKKIDGVTRVVNDLTIVAPTYNEDAGAESADSDAQSDDERVARDIAAALNRHKVAGDLEQFNIDLDVDSGIVVLKGRVSSADQQKLALKAAEQVAGVTKVIDALTIQGEGEQVPRMATDVAITDDMIAKQIAERLQEAKRDGQLKGFGVNLRVDNGIVSLDGRVSDPTQLQLTMEIADSAEGVRDVINQIVIAKAKPFAQLHVARTEGGDSPIKLVGHENQPTLATQAVAIPATSPDLAESEGSTALFGAADGADTTADQRIGNELMEKLREAKTAGNLRGFGIAVHVNRGYVWLKGRVASAEQQTLALQAAQSVKGVRQVINELTISDSNTIQALAESDIATSNSSVAIARGIDQRLRAAKQNGHLFGSNLDVKVQGGQVVLSGHVTSQQQHAIAVDIARRVPGVEKVVDAVQVAPGYMASGPMNPYAQHPAYLAAYRGGYPANPVNYPAPANGPIDQTPRPLNGLQMAAMAPAAALAAPMMAISQQGQMRGPAHLPSPGSAVQPARYDHPNLPGYAWPSYTAHPNYAGLTYPKQYSPSAWPYIGPFYPYPQVPLGWRKVTLKWDDGWWNLDFKSK